MAATVIRAVHRTLKTKLADLNKNLRMFIDDVDKSGMLVLWTHTNENIDKLRANTQISTGMCLCRATRSMLILAFQPVISARRCQSMV